MMNQIIIPTTDIEKYHHRIDRQNEIRPIAIETDKGVVYTLPLDVLNIAKIDRFFLKLKTIGEVETELKDMPIQDITITSIIDKKK